MKTIKTLMLTGILALSMTTGAFASEEEVNKGPLESYYDCANGCIERTDPWTWRRTLCAADCYLQLIADVKELMEA